MNIADDQPLRLARTREAVSRNLLIYALLAEHHARMHLALARFGVASMITSVLSAFVTPLLFPLAFALAVITIALVVQLRRGNAAIRALYGGPTITLPKVARRAPGSAAVADAVAQRARREREHADALGALVALECR